MTQDELKLEELNALDVLLQKYLHKHFVKVQKLNGETMMYDKKGKSAFVVVAFNHPVDLSLLPDDASSDDLMVAIGSASSMVEPNVHPDPETQTIGPAESIPHGVQAVAAGLLLGSLQNGAIYNAMGVAQQITLAAAHKKRSLN